MRWWLLVMALVAGCERKAPAPVVAPRKPQVVVEVGRLTPLPPDRRTHVTSNGQGQVYWVQEAERGRETVFALSDDGLPSATRMTNQMVAEALGEAGATGSIQSLVAGADGRLFFFFNGGTRRKTLAAVGWFNPAGGGELKLIATTEELTRVSGLGASLALARGTLVWVGTVPWLWLRHEEGYALVSVDLLGGGLRRVFERVRGGGEAGLRLTSAREDLTAGAAGGLLYLDRAGGKVWRIDGLGDAKLARDVSDLPRELTGLQAGADGSEVAFAPDVSAFVEKETEGAVVVSPATRPVTFPGLVVFRAEGRTVLGRGRFEPRLRDDLMPGELVRDRGAWLIYDGQAGELLRLRVLEK